MIKAAMEYVISVKIVKVYLLKLLESKCMLIISMTCLNEFINYYEALNV